MKPPCLETERLFVQPLSEADAKPLYTYRTHPDVTRFQSLMFKNESEALHFIQGHEGHDFGIPGTWFQLGVYLKPDMLLVGDIGLHFLDEDTRTVEMGYTIAPAYQRKGYAFEALRRILAFLFTVCKTKTVIAVTDHDNHPSIHLLAKMDFIKAIPETLPFDLELLDEEVVFTRSQFS